MIVSADTGQAFVIVPEDADDGQDDGAGAELRPVANLTSARLVLGPDVEPAVVSQDAIEEQRIGPEIGIQDAPASPPPPGLLVQTGWTACATGAWEPLLRLGGAMSRPVAGAGQVVAVDRSDVVLDRAKALARRRRVGNVLWKRGELEKLPLKDASVDVALLSQALHHALSPARAVAEAAVTVQ